MARWDPQAEERLRTAAIDLFLERGYENVTVAQIAERAGLTRRTFSRYFADKRDVMFAGSERLPLLLAAAVRSAEPGLAPYDVVVTALVAAAADLSSAVAPQQAARRREVTAASPELQERALTKFAAVAEAMAAALGDRGLDATDSRLFADVGVAIFVHGFNRWVDSPDDADLATRLREAGSLLR